MERLKQALDCSHDSLMWLQNHFNTYGYFEKNYYDPTLCPATPTLAHAISTGRGLWCTAEGTLAFLEIFLTIRKCGPMLRELEIDTTRDWFGLEQWMEMKLLPDVIRFFGDAINQARDKDSNRSAGKGLLPNVPERGDEVAVQDGVRQVFAVDGTARVLLALCRIRDYWTLRPSKVPSFGDSSVAAVSKWWQQLEELIQRAAEAIRSSQYTQANYGEVVKRDEGGWRRHILDEQPCLMDPTAFAILGLFAADPKLYSREIAAGCDWIRRRGVEIGIKSAVGASSNSKGVGWSWCPQLSETDNPPDPTSTAFALLALSEVFTANDEKIREAVLYIQDSLYFEDRDVIFDGLVFRGYTFEQTYFSVLPTLPRTLAALLKSNAVGDSNYYKVGPDKFILSLVDEIVKRHNDHGGWKVHLSELDRAKLLDQPASSLPPDCKDTHAFISHPHIWYSYTSLHALSLFVLYECCQGNLPSWMPAQKAAKLGYKLAAAQKRSDLALKKSDIKDLQQQVNDQSELIGDIKDQLAVILTQLNNRRNRRSEILKRVKNFGLKAWKRVLAPIVILLLIYAIAYHLGLDKAARWFPAPPTWLTAIGAIAVAITYLDHFFHFLPSFLRVSTNKDQPPQMPKGETPQSAAETEKKDDVPLPNKAAAAAAGGKSGESQS